MVKYNSWIDKIISSKRSLVPYKLDNGEKRLINALEVALDDERKIFFLYSSERENWCYIDTTEDDILFSVVNQELTNWLETRWQEIKLG